MLTWAYVYLVTRQPNEWGSGLHLVTAMFCDVALVYFGASGFAGRAL